MILKTCSKDPVVYSLFSNRLQKLNITNLFKLYSFLNIHHHLVGFRHHIDNQIIFHLHKFMSMYSWQELYDIQLQNYKFYILHSVIYKCLYIRKLMFYYKLKNLTIVNYITDNLKPNPRIGHKDMLNYDIYLIWKLKVNNS